MRRLPVLLAAVLVASAGLAGCGLSSPPTSQGTSTNAPSGGGGGHKVELQAKDFSFDPTSLDAKAGTITITVANGDSVEHNLTIEGLGIDKDLEAGDDTSVTAKAKPGTYQYYCGYHPTKMKGTITVE